MRIPRVESIVTGMKSRISRRPLQRALPAAFLAASLLLSTTPGAAISASDTTSTWTPSSTPSHDDLVILPGSDIIDFAVAGPDGSTLYAIGLWYDECLEDGEYQHWSDGENVLHEQLVPRLWKSSDRGVTWKDITSNVQDASGMPSGEQFVFFSAIAAAPDDADFVFVAGYDRNQDAMVAGSDDGGDTFEIAGSGVIAGEVLCLAISPEYNSRREVAAGTRDLTDGGRVWRLQVGGSWPAYWIDTTTYDGWLDAPTWTANEDVFAITSLEFSPAFDYDHSIVGVALGLGFDPTLASTLLSDPIGEGDGFYPAFHYFAGEWNSLNAWNTAADFEAFPSTLRVGPLLLYASTYYIAGAWQTLFQSPVLRMATDIALPYDFTAADPVDMVALVSVNGSVVPPAAGLPVDAGGYLFLLQSMAPTFELLHQDGNPFVSSIAYHGSIKMMGHAMVGLAFPETWIADSFDEWPDGVADLDWCGGVTVLYTDRPIGPDPCCPDNWRRAEKPPSGQFNARVAFTPDGRHAYASTQGYSYVADPWQRSDESAFSVSTDFGACWNQTGLIDTDIDHIADVVLAGECSDVVIATINYRSGDQGSDCDSVWRSRDGGDTWLRIWHGALLGDYMEGEGLDGDEWAVLGVPATDEDELVTIYMADLGADYIYHATFGGLCAWEPRRTPVDDIADIAVRDHTSLYVLGADGKVARSDNSGGRWTTPVDSKAADKTGETAHTITARGDWVLVGGDMGTVSYSRDGGRTFSILDDIGGGEVHLAFDSYFGDNGYVYAAVADPLGEHGGVYRTTIEAADFERIDGCPGLDYWGIVVSHPEGNPHTGASTGGVLYASYSGSTGGACKESGVARLLNPAAEPCCIAHDWDYLFNNVWESADFGTQPSNLAICGCLSPDTDTTIWAIDSHPYYDGWDDCVTRFADGDVGRLWQFTDCFSKSGPALIGAADGAVIAADDCDDCDSIQFILEWDRICDACEYDIEIALDAGFTHKVWSTSVDSIGTWPGASIETHTACDGILECESPRAFYKPSDPCAPSIVVPAGKLPVNQDYYWRVRARYAETGEAYRSQWSETWSFTVAASGRIGLSSPANGATGVPRENVVFTWSAVSGAASYQFALWDANGAEVASSSQANTSYVLGQTLDYDSSYTWQVKAMRDGQVINESDIATFRTMVQPVPPPEFPEYPDTIIQWPEPPGTPAWIWVVIALAAILIIVVIVLIFRTRRV